MKTKIKPIAMRCSKKQYNEIKNKLNHIDNHDWRMNFKEYPYLTNNYDNEFSIGTHDKSLIRKKVEIHETWNEKVFLEACGIKVEEPKEESFVITREQIYDLCHPSLKTNRERLEVYFPSAFEPEKKELVVGKWYKSNIGSLAFYSGNEENYGISTCGNWNDQLITKTNWNKCESGIWTEATQQEVEEAIGNEIKRRYKVGNRVNCLKCGNLSLNCELNLDSFDHYFEDDEMWVSFDEGEKTDSMVCVYYKGIFAEIIQPKKMTKAEIETELGYYVEIIK